MTETKETAESGRPPQLWEAANQFARTITGIRALRERVEPHLGSPADDLRSVFDGLRPDETGAAFCFVVTALTQRRRAELRDVGQDSSQHRDDQEPPSSSSAVEEGAVEGEDVGLAASEASLSAESVGGTAAEDAAEEISLQIPKSWTPEIARAARGEIDVDEAFETLTRTFGGATARLMGFMQKIQGLFLDPNKVQLLNASMLVTAVAAFEALLSRVLDIQHRRFPGLLPKEEKQFSLADLQTFEAIDDAIDAAIESRVESLMRESFDFWEKWFESRTKTDLRELCIDYEALREALERRNVLVHNGGAVSRLYLTRLKRKEPPPGTQLGVSAEYLDGALDELTVLGVGLAATLECLWSPADGSETVDALNHKVFELLQEGRDKAAIKLAEIGQAVVDPEEWSAQALKVNRWIGIKRRDGLAAIEDEVRDWKISALAPTFRLAKAALLHDVEETLRLLPDALEDGAVSPHDLATWPLFEDLRLDADAAPLLQDLMHGETDDEEVADDELPSDD